MPSRSLSSALTLAGLVLSCPATAESVSAEAVAQRVEAQHAGLRSLTADFVQVYRSGALGREITERGSLAIRRPGRMRWEYRAPDHKLFVCDGQTAYFYVPEDRQVTVKQIEGSEGLAFRLLLGDLKLREEFTVALDADHARARTRLVLTPREPNAEVARLSLDLDASYRIVGIEITDLEGNRSGFTFDRLRENPSLPDNLFTFSIPDGVEVLGG